MYLIRVGIFGVLLGLFSAAIAFYRMSVWFPGPTATWEQALFCGGGIVFVLGMVMFAVGKMDNNRTGKT